MKNLKTPLLAVLNLLVLALPVLAQTTRRSNPDADAACGMVGCGIVVWLIVMLVVFGISIAIIIFIYKFIRADAIARGDNPGKAWFALLGLLGLLIYVLTRPPGVVMPCPGCGQKRMQGSPRCPNCGKP